MPQKIELLLRFSASSWQFQQIIDEMTERELLKAIPILEQKPKTKQRVKACKEELKRRGVLTERPNPTESEEQQALFLWASVAQGKYPELAMMFHIPNERKCSPATGGRLRAEGVRSGVPDICLPVARGRYHALYIEMKRIGGKARKEQIEWIANLKRAGNAVAVCEGWENAQKVIEQYLGLGGNFDG